MKKTTGSATVEMALIFMTVVVPLTFGVIAFADLAWTYHSLATLTRQGARYAATHCWVDPNGSNVVAWMQANSPPFLDRRQLVTGEAQIQVNYWSHDTAAHQTIPFTCGGSCSPACVPDSVTVSITGYQFRAFFSLLGMTPLAVPSFSTTVEMHSMGANPDTGASAT